MSIIVIKCIFIHFTTHATAVAPVGITISKLLHSEANLKHFLQNNPLFNEMLHQLFIERGGNLSSISFSEFYALVFTDPMFIKKVLKAIKVILYSTYIEIKSYNEIFFKWNENTYLGNLMVHNTGQVIYFVPDPSILKHVSSTYLMNFFHLLANNL